MLQSLQIQNNRDRRLHSYFSNFRLHIQHISGEKNKLADYLSRLPEGMTSAQKVEWQIQDDDDMILQIHKTDGCEQGEQSKMSEQSKSMHANIEPVGQINDQSKSQVCIENDATENDQHFVNVVSENQQNEAVSTKQSNREFSAYVLGEINCSEQDIIAAIHRSLDQLSANTDKQQNSQHKDTAQKHSKQKVAHAVSQQSNSLVITRAVNW